MAYNTYAITTGLQTLSAATTLVCIRPNTTASLRILRVEVSQKGTTTEEMIRFQIGWKASAYATGLTSVNVGSGTAPSLNAYGSTALTSTITGGTSAAAGTAGTWSTSEGLGTFQPLHEACVSNKIGYQWTPGPGEEIVARAGSSLAFVVRAPATATTTASWEATVVWEEI